MSKKSVTNVTFVTKGQNFSYYGILKGDTFNINMSQSDIIISNLENLHIHKKLNFEMKMSLCDTFKSKLSRFEITKIIHILTNADKSQIYDTFFSSLSLYENIGILPK